MTEKEKIKAKERALEAFPISEDSIEANFIRIGKRDAFELGYLKAISDIQEEPISEALLDEIHNRWEDDPHTKWPKCPYKDFKNIACHFANYQKRQMIDKFNEWCQEEFYIHPHDCHVVQYVSDKPLEDIDDFIKEFERKMSE